MGRFTGLRLGWVCYSSLRRDRLSPIASVDKYYTAIQEITAETGLPLHWIPLKELTPDCHHPGPSAEDDELEIHKLVTHYGDCMAPLAYHYNRAPAQGKYEWCIEHPFDPDELEYELPLLDAVIVESTHQIGAAYVLTFTLKLLAEINPDIGFIFIDQDLSGTACRGKAAKWMPNIEERSVLATYHPTRSPAKASNQTVLKMPYMAYRERPISVEGDSVAYVGNDYLRRKLMEKYLSGPRFHLYGRLKPEFHRDMLLTGCRMHGSFIPSRNFTLEDVYRQHGFGIQIARHDYYEINLVTQRLGEIVRSGVVCFQADNMRLARPLVSDWCMVDSPEQLLQRVDTLVADPSARQQIAEYQRQAARYYLHSTRYSNSLLYAAEALTLTAGSPLRNWTYNAYDDLCELAGLPRWSQS